MKRFGAMLVLVVAAQAALADPSAARTSTASAFMDAPAAAVADKLAEAELRMQKVTARKIRHSVQEAIGQTVARDFQPQGVAVQLTMSN